MSKIGYTSDVMEFIKSHNLSNKTVAADKVNLRATWWDKSEEDVLNSKELLEDNIKASSYVYFGHPKQ